MGAKEVVYTRCLYTICKHIYIYIYIYVHTQVKTPTRELSGTRNPRKLFRAEIDLAFSLGKTRQTSQPFSGCLSEATLFGWGVGAGLKGNQKGSHKSAGVGLVGFEGNQKSHKLFGLGCAEYFCGATKNTKIALVLVGEVCLFPSFRQPKRENPRVFFGGFFLPFQNTHPFSGGSLGPSCVAQRQHAAPRRPGPQLLHGEHHPAAQQGQPGPQVPQNQSGGMVGWEWGWWGWWGWWGSPSAEPELKKPRVRSLREVGKNEPRGPLKGDYKGGRECGMEWTKGSPEKGTTRWMVYSWMVSCPNWQDAAVSKKQAPIPAPSVRAHGRDTTTTCDRCDR